MGEDLGEGEYFSIVSRIFNENSGASPDKTLLFFS
jgi:hypothetical protein